MLVWPTNLPKTGEDSLVSNFKGGPGRRYLGTLAATPIAAALAALIVQYTWIWQGRILGHKNISSFHGIRRIFVKIAPNKVQGFHNLIPKELLSIKKEDILPSFISERLRGIEH